MLISFKRSRSSFRGPASLKTGRGFTLIELLAVVAIMVIVTTILLTNQSQFNSSTVLRSLAYSVALSMRQAQVYGTSVLGTSTTLASCQSGSYANGECYAAAFGLHFSYGSTYKLYADLNNSGYYDSGEDVKDFTLSNGYYIGTVCVDNNGADYCSGSCPAAPYPFGVASCNSNVGGLTWVDVVFHRPNPDACIYEPADLSKQPCIIGGSNSYSGAYIQVTNTASSTRGILINTTGQITVEGAGT